MDKMVTENEYSSWLFCTLQSEIEVAVGSVRKITIRQECIEEPVCKAVRPKAMLNKPWGGDERWKC